METISQNMFYVILVAIVLIGLLVAVLQWRRVRKGNKEVEFLNNLAKNRKTEMDERGLEFNTTNDIVLSKEQSEKLTQIRENISNLMYKEGCLSDQVDKRFKHIEASTTHVRFQKLLLEIDE